MRLWRYIFFGLVVGYGWYYAPFGVNETDGGFLTGLAWQVLNGKLLYQDIVYVRPPLPVYLRALELQLLPEHLAVLGERWIFYAKLAFYSWLAAILLARDERRWQLATLGFVVSAHCYPPMAWHTVDGILFAVLAVYLAAKNTRFSLFFAGICLLLSMLCKQSFYPLLPLFALWLLVEKAGRLQRMLCFAGGWALGWVGFFSQHDPAVFFRMTQGAASVGQAWQHGIVDYFLITPELALPSLLLLAPVAGWFWKNRFNSIALTTWNGWLVALAVSYAAVTWLRQEHTAPFAQSRALFWVAGIYFLLATRGIFARQNLTPVLLLAITWCAAVSWGYNLPLLFSTPWIWAAMEITRRLEKGQISGIITLSTALGMLLLLLFAFRIGHEFVYRDGRRSEMKTHMGDIFPSLTGIYSDAASGALYRDLQQLAARYGPVFKTLPAFPQANFLTGTRPPLPLDWVVNRETNGDNTLIMREIAEQHPVIFIQKSFQEKIATDPELEITRRVLEQGRVLEETPFFTVITLKK
ncbi:MAG: hypothetical protein SFV22_17035 [Saprospiraceae bacterium]|nr:hypothetical protein [Saprospiraceae bacterium]